MATGDGHADSPLIKRILAQPHEHSFFAVARALEKSLPSLAEVGTGSSPADEPLHFAPSTNLSFPSSDLAGLEWSDDRKTKLRLIATFLGLYGVASPLPYYFQQTAAGDGSGSAALRAFLNLFDQRIYAFYYRAWKKQRLAELIDSRSQLRARVFIGSLAGLVEAREDQSSPADLRLLASGGLFSILVKSARGLESVLREFFRVRIVVREHAALWRDNPEPARLGDKLKKLGRSIAIGSRICDRAGSFLVQIGPLLVDEARRFLPGSIEHSDLRRVVAQYAPDYLSYEVHLRVQSAGAPAVKLGDEVAPLGWLSWLGAPARETEEVFVGEYDAA